MKTQKLGILGLALLILIQTAWAQETPKLVVQDGHGSQIVELIFFDGGLAAATASEDGTVKVWDVLEQRVVRTIYDKEKFQPHDSLDALKEAVFFPDKKEVIVQGNGLFRHFQLETGNKLAEFKVEGYRGGLQTDGTYLYFVTDQGAVKSSLGGKILSTIPHPGKMDRWNYQKTSIGGSRLALNHTDEVALVSLPDFTIEKRLPVNGLGKLALSPDGGQLALGDREKFLLFDTESGATAWTFTPDQLPEGARGSSCTLYYSPYWDADGNLYWGRYSNAGDINFLVKQGDSLLPVAGREGDIVLALASQPGGELLVAHLNGNFEQLHPDGSSDVFPSQSAGVTAVDLSQEHRVMVTGSRDGVVKLWDLKTGRLTRKLPGLRAYVGSVSLSPDAKKVVASDLYYGEVKVWDLETGAPLSDFKVRSHGFGTGVSMVQFIDDREYLLLRTSDPRISIVNAATGEESQYREFGESGVQEAVFHPYLRRVATVDSKGLVTEWGLDSARDRLSKKMKGNWGAQSVLTYSADGRTLLAVSNRGGVYRWKFDDPANEFEPVATPWNSTDHVYLRERKDGTILSVGPYGEMRVLHPDGRIERTAPVANGYISRFTPISDDLVLFNTAAEALVFANPQTGEYLGEIVEFDSGDGWVVFTKDGRFDGNKTGFKKLEFELGGTLYSLEQFFNDYYQPGLLATFFPGGEEPPASTRSTVALTEQNLKKPPKVSITSPKSGDTIEKSEFEVTVKVEPQGAGVSKVGLYHNGHRLPEAGRQKVDDSTYKFRVKAVKGVNDLRATAFDASGSVESRKDRARVKAPEIEARPPRLHLLAVGVDDYKAGLNLKFAKDDATSIGQLFQSNLYDAGERVVLTNKEATLDGILAGIEGIGAQSEPQDALVIYLAGHGTVLGETYYFLPHDADIVSDQSLATTALSSERLAKELSQVPATKQLLVLDSCRSGAAVGALGKYLAARSGLEEIRSQQLLARTSGTFLIAATKAEEYAYEIPELGHGVLTYALLNSLGKAGESNESTTTANGLLQSVSVKVPALSEQYHGTRQQVIQYSSGQDFPLLKK